MDPFGGYLPGSWHYGLILIFQAICIIQVLRRGREFFWIWIILVLPVIGGLIYLYLHGGLRLSAINPARFIRIPMLEIFDARQVERDFRLTGNLDNRIRYADVLMSRGDSAGAITLFDGELAGPFKNNVNMLFAYAKALFAAGSHADSLAALDRAEGVPNNDRIKQRYLLQALNLETLGRIIEADARFLQAQGGFLGEEAKARYGLFLLAVGRRDEARRQFERIVEALAISNWGYRTEQRVWARLAKEQLRLLARGAPDRRPSGADTPQKPDR